MAEHPARNYRMLGAKFLAGIDEILASVPEPERDPRYWSCWCLENYVHPVEQQQCLLCGAQRDSSPHSLASEVTDDGQTHPDEERG